MIYGNPITLSIRGGLELTVVGGTTQPSSPKNNTLWVNTDVAIGAVSLGPAAPDSPVLGDVWVNTGVRYGTGSTVAVGPKTLAVCENPFLEINVMNFMQYDGLAWAWCDGGVYANGAWSGMALYIYYYGTLNELYPFSCGRCKTDGTTLSNADINYSETYFTPQSTYSTSITRGVVITNPGHVVDVSQFSKVGVRAFINLTDTSSTLRIGFTTDTTSEITSLTPSIARNAQYIDVAATSEATDYTIDITATGIVRPTLTYISNSTSCAYSFHYWVLT